MPFDYEKTMRARWSKREKDIVYDYPSKLDGWAMHDFFMESKFKDFLKELEDRGYDPATFIFQIDKKKEKEETTK